MLEGGPRGAGHEVQQRLIIALGAQRKRCRLHHLQLRAGIGAVGLQERRRARDFHGFGNIAGRQLHVDTRAAVDGERDILARLLFEPGHLHRDRVLPRRHIRKRIVPAFVGLTGSTDAGVDLGEGDFGVGNYRATAVSDRAEKRGVDCLRIAEAGCQQQ